MLAGSLWSCQGNRAGVRRQVGPCRCRGQVCDPQVCCRIFQRLESSWNPLSWLLGSHDCEGVRQQPESFQRFISFFPMVSKNRQYIDKHKIYRLSLHCLLDNSGLKPIDHLSPRVPLLQDAAFGHLPRAGPYHEVH